MSKAGSKNRGGGGDDDGKKKAQQKRLPDLNLIGQTIYKKFGNYGCFWGEVKGINYNPEEDVHYYYVVYSDGDHEEMWHDDVENGMAAAKENKDKYATKSPAKKPEQKPTKPIVPRLSSVVQTLTQNDWLSAKDLCRLEGTSNEYARVVEGSWRALCSLTWPNWGTGKQAFVVIEKLGGYKKFYRNRKSSYCAQETFSSPMPPPKLRPQNFGLLIDLTVQGKTPLSYLLPGKRLAPLLHDGTAAFALNKPFVVSTARCWMNRRIECNCIVPCARGQADVAAKIHLLRESRGTGTTCCIYDPPHGRSNVTIDAPSIGNPENGVYDWKHEKIGAWQRLRKFWERAEFPTGLAFQPTTAAAEIRMRLGYQVISFSFSIRFSIIAPGDKVAITDIRISAMVGEYRGEVMVGYDKEKAKETGVSILQILEQLQGIEK